VTERNRDIPTSQYDDKETQDILNALHRAVRRAHKIAHQQKTGVVVLRDGEVIEIDPDPKMYGEEQEK
jgi:ABC-type multidrug transport system fused ATPase/permease subunit